MSRPGERFLDLVEVMDRLRSPGGCPWDARQTHASLVEYLIEEAYETVEAIEDGDDAALREELGDVLLQVVFHSRIAQDAAGWNIDDVADGIITKLIHRHPHVFADVTAETAEEVEANWHRLKAQEKGRESVTDGIPRNLPALLLASKVLQRTREFKDALSSNPQAPAASEAMTSVNDEASLGDLLFAITAQARERGLDSEAALRDAARRQIQAVRALEGLDQ